MELCLSLHYLSQVARRTLSRVRAKPKVKPRSLSELPQKRGHHTLNHRPPHAAHHLSAFLFLFDTVIMSAKQESTKAEHKTKKFGKSERSIPHHTQKAKKFYPAEDEAKPKKVREVL